VLPYALKRRNDARVSTNEAYLEPAGARDNLRIIGDALVDSIEFDGRAAVRFGCVRAKGGSQHASEHRDDREKMADRIRGRTAS